MSEAVVSGVRRLSTISEKDVDGEAEPKSLVSSVDNEWTGSSTSLCSQGNKPSVQSSTFTSFESFQTDTSDECATILLACLYCRFCDIMAMLPDTCERAFTRFFPSYKYFNTSDEQSKGKDWCGCNMDCDCSLMNACQETSELLELAMEISELLYSSNRLRHLSSGFSYSCTPDKSMSGQLLHFKFIMSQASKISDGVCDHVTEIRLVHSDCTWSRNSSVHVEGRLSDAKIYESSTKDGVTWTVVSPIVFTYRVVQCERLLDASNDTLLLGHIANSEEIQDLKNNTKSMKRFIVIDETVNDLYGSQITAYFEARGVTYKMLPLPTTEENKSMTLVTRILEEVHKFGIDRRTEPIIAIGGGVCLDITGLAASLYRRRTPYIRVPTTLLAYIDASVGAKNGVNFANCKNKLGSYIPPVATFLDRTFLYSLPRRHVSNGMAEMLKMALMKHKGLFELLEKEGRHLLDCSFQLSGNNPENMSTDAASVSTRLAIETMLEELAPNLWEDDLDRLVDFGHFISPELEMKVLPAILHGEAVNIDMAFMVYVAHERGFLTEEEKRRIIVCMQSLDLPVWHSDCTLDLIQKSMTERLKHSGGHLRMPLPTALGKARIFNDTEERAVCQAFKKWCDELCETPMKL